MDDESLQAALKDAIDKDAIEELEFDSIGIGKRLFAETKYMRKFHGSGDSPERSLGLML